VTLRQEMKSREQHQSATDDWLQSFVESYSSLLDLDHDFFTSKPIHDNISASPVPIPRHSPTRSPTYPHQQLWHPPLASPLPPANQLFQTTAYLRTTTAPTPIRHSSLSLRWMSSLLSGSNTVTLSVSSSTPIITDGSPSLDMLFNVESSPSKPWARSNDPHQRPTFTHTRVARPGLQGSSTIGTRGFQRNLG
jgi:hypothetical protein